MDALVSLLVPGGSFTVAIGGVLAAIAALVIGYFKAVAKGRKDERQRQNNEAWEARHTQDEIERAIAGNDPASNRKEASQWVKP
jgi:hypothetical protein